MYETAQGWGSWHRCPRCELEFVDPMVLSSTPMDLFDDAYRGRQKESRMEEFHERIAIRAALKEEPELWFWTPAFESTINWLEQRYGTGAIVLELGCGLGFFLHAARKRGFHIDGLDVALRAVELNRQDGFRVWHGTLDSMPPDWVQPDAVVCFFMLHHLERPKEFLEEIRRRWPTAGVAISQYGPSNRDPLSSTPPRTLTKWSARSLQSLLERTGYRVATREFTGSGTQRGPVRRLRKVVKRTLVLPPVYRALRRLDNRYLTRALSPLGKDAYVVLAVAEPKA